MKTSKCWCCGKQLPQAHGKFDCPDGPKVHAMTVEQLKEAGFVCLEGGGFVHPDYLKRTETA